MITTKKVIKLGMDTWWLTYMSSMTYDSNSRFNYGHKLRPIIHHTCIIFRPREREEMIVTIRRPLEFCGKLKVKTGTRLEMCRGWSLRGRNKCFPAYQTPVTYQKMSITQSYQLTFQVSVNSGREEEKEEEEASQSIWIWLLHPFMFLFFFFHFNVPSVSKDFWNVL